MCGIFSLSSPARPISRDTVHHALAAISHRGPDGEGIWMSDDQHVALGHRRLSIIDLAGGAQPLHNTRGDIHIVVNGEIYDHRRQRDDLIARGHVFSTRSDSEVALHLYAEHGLDFVHHLRGEFALIIYDARTDTLIAARDRFGIKPLCFAQSTDGTLCMASEAKAIFAAGFTPAWDHEAFYHACTLQYTPADRSVFAGIRQLPPGHLLVARNGAVSLRPYWDIDFAPEKDSQRSDQDWIDAFSSALRDSVALRLDADVPVCTHLSGGIDSSTITALATQADRGVKDSFIVRFDGDSGYDETPVAQEMAHKVGITLSIVEVDGDSVADHLGDAAWFSEGISINSHLIGKYMLNRAIRAAGYKVALSGEGADELLAGYPHLREDTIDSHAAPATARQNLYAGNAKLAGVFLADGDMLDSSGMTGQLGYTPAFLRAKASLGHRLHALLRDDYRHAMHAHDPFAEMAARYKQAVAPLSRVDAASHLWTKSALANYILRTLGDGCEMPHAVEGRVPFLDHHLWEMARAMPAHLKIRDMTEKFILREAARPLITETLYKRQKHPFIAPPGARMMTARLRQMMRDTLGSASFSSMPFFEPTRVHAWLDTYENAPAQAQVSNEPVLMTLLTAAALHDRYRMSA